MSKIKETKNTKQNEYKLKQKYIKYPFSGVASNLIDKFLVLGYEQQDIDKTLFDDEPKKLNINNNFLKYVNFQERPSVINEVCSNYKKESQDNDVIIQIIFPNFPQLIFIEKNNDPENKDKEKLDRYEELESKLIIFSLNPQDNNGNKKSFNGFGYTFYSRKEHRNEVHENRNSSCSHGACLRGCRRLPGQSGAGARSERQGPEGVRSRKERTARPLRRQLDHVARTASADRLDQQLGHGRVRARQGLRPPAPEEDRRRPS